MKNFLRNIHHVTGLTVDQGSTEVWCCVDGEYWMVILFNN